MFHLLLGALLAHAVSATDVFSLGDFKTRFAGLGAPLTGSAADLDLTSTQIKGSTAPTESTDVADLWRWYRGVDSSTRAAAEKIMEEKAGTFAVDNELSQNLDFKSKYEALKIAADDHTIAGTAVATLAKDLAFPRWVTADTMGTAKVNEFDVTAEMKTVWRTYHSFSPALQAQLKKEVLFAPFVKLFKTDWKAANAVADHIPNDFAKATTLLSKTMKDPGTHLYDGKDTNKIWEAFAKEERQQLVDIMLSGTPSITSVLV